jgi:hypothetical protein
MSNTAHLTLLAADHRVRLAVVTRPPDSLDYTPPIAWCVLNPVTQMKVSTGRPNPNARDPSVGVIILYCGFEDDEAETGSGQDHTAENEVHRYARMLEGCCHALCNSAGAVQCCVWPSEKPVCWPQLHHLGAADNPQIRAGLSHHPEVLGPLGCPP